MMIQRKYSFPFLLLLGISGCGMSVSPTPGGTEENGSSAANDKPVIPTPPPKITFEGIDSGYKGQSVEEADGKIREFSNVTSADGAETKTINETFESKK